jgi:MoaA/NifB/PqqE/SkfB family radical SAM enzyme
MPRDVFERAVEATIRPGQRYHLQGWGEPLLRPDLPDLARSIAERGGLPSVTTNGTEVTPDLAQSLVDAGIEFVTFSVAGGRPEAQRRNRPGTDLEGILESVRVLKKARKKGRRRKPILAASFEMSRTSVDSLGDAVKKLKKAGVERLIAVHPILTLTAEQESNLVFDPTGKRTEERTVKALRQAAVAAMWRSLPFDFDPIEPDLGSVCREDPVRSVFVGASGDVFPCVYLGLPVEGAYPIRYLGREVIRRRVSMGSLRERTLEEIWSSPDYVAFREAFSTTGRTPPEPCRSCLRALGY